MLPAVGGHSSIRKSASSCFEAHWPTAIVTLFLSIEGILGFCPIKKERRSDNRSCSFSPLQGKQEIAHACAAGPFRVNTAGKSFRVMDGRVETSFSGRPIQGTNRNFLKITTSEPGIRAICDMTNVPGRISQHVCRDTIHLHGVGSQNDPIHDNRVMTDLGMQISLEAVYKSQMGDQDTVSTARWLCAD